MKLVAYRWRCDTPTCTALWPVDDWTTDPHAWRQAKAAGWSRDYDHTHCPEHAPDAALVDRVRALAGQIPDAQIGQRLGLSRSAVQTLRHRHNIPGLRPGRPACR